MPGSAKRLVVPSAIAAAVVVGLGACNSSPCTVELAGAGSLNHASCDAPIKHLSKTGWRTEIHQGRVAVMPPVQEGVDDLRYVFDGAHEAFDQTSLRAWPGGPRTVVLPGGAKLTMHTDAGRLARVSLYDGDESHEVDVLRHAISRSAVEGSTAVAGRDAAEADGEGGYLLGFPHLVHLVNAYVQAAAEDGAVQEPALQIGILGSQAAYDPYTQANVGYARTEASLPLPPAAPSGTDVEGACAAPGEVRGRLVQDGGSGQPLEYVSRNGGTTVKIDKHTITVTVNEKFTWQVWGDPHENLNGKHIKDWLDPGLRRTLLLPGGMKVTMHADGPDRVVHTTSIYDGAQSHEIDNVGNQTRHSCVDAAVAQQREAQEPDGETAVLGILRTRLSELGALYAANVYHESAAADGGPHVVRIAPEALGLTGEGDINPKQVNDLFDDPRLGHT